MCQISKKFSESSTIDIYPNGYPKVVYQKWRTYLAYTSGDLKAKGVKVLASDLTVLKAGNPRSSINRLNIKHYIIQPISPTSKMDNNVKVRPKLKNFYF